jgi:DNA-binding transcriptional MerR regulator
MADTTLDLAIYSIKAVAHMAGVAEPTLRAWEKRYEVLAPKRTDSGHRRYTRRDINRVIWLKQRLAEGIAISQAALLLQSQPEAVFMEPKPAEGRFSFVAPGQPEKAALLPAYNPARPDAGLVRSPQVLMSQLLEAFLAFDEAAACNLLAEATSFYPPEMVCINIIQNALEELGELWAHHETTVVNEHFASAICRGRVTAMLEGLPLPQNGPLVLTACAPTELHELGILITTYCLRRHGWRVLYLGQNVPAGDLAYELKRLKPALIVFSTSQPESAYRLAEEIGPVITQVRQDGLAGLLFGYGGRVFIEKPGLRDLFKKELYFGNNALDSVELMEKTFSRN